MAAGRVWFTERTSSGTKQRRRERVAEPVGLVKERDEFLKQNHSAGKAARKKAAGAAQCELQPHLSPPAYLAVQSRDDLHLFGTVLSVWLPAKVRKVQDNKKKLACWRLYLMDLLRSEVDKVAVVDSVDPVQVVADWVLEEILVAGQKRSVGDELKVDEVVHSRGFSTRWLRGAGHESLQPLAFRVAEVAAFKGTPALRLDGVEGLGLDALHRELAWRGVTPGRDWNLELLRFALLSALIAQPKAYLQQQLEHSGKLKVASLRAKLKDTWLSVAAARAVDAYAAALEELEDERDEEVDDELSGEEEEDEKDFNDDGKAE